MEVQKVEVRCRCWLAENRAIFIVIRNPGFELLVELKVKVNDLRLDKSIVCRC